MKLRLPRAVVQSAADFPINLGVFRRTIRRAAEVGLGIGRIGVRDQAALRRWLSSTAFDTEPKTAGALDSRPTKIDENQARRTNVSHQARGRGAPRVVFQIATREQEKIGYRHRRNPGAERTRLRSQFSPGASPRAFLDRSRQERSSPDRVEFAIALARRQIDCKRRLDFRQFALPARVTDRVRRRMGAGQEMTDHSTEGEPLLILPSNEEPRFPIQALHFFGRRRCGGEGSEERRLRVGNGSQERGEAENWNGMRWCCERCINWSARRPESIVLRAWRVICNFTVCNGNY